MGQCIRQLAGQAAGQHACLVAAQLRGGQLQAGECCDHVVLKSRLQLVMPFTLCLMLLCRLSLSLLLSNSLPPLLCSVLYSLCRMRRWRPCWFTVVLFSRHLNCNVVCFAPAAVDGGAEGNAG